MTPGIWYLLLVELIVAPVAQLRTEITRSFEETTAGVIEAGTGGHDLRRCACALTGGSTALIFLGALRDANAQWSHITLFWGDERAVPPDHPDSNFGLVERLLLMPLGARAPYAVRMRAEVSDLAAAAREYERELPAVLDLVILGIGEDGHICSLFPGHRALMVEDARVLVIDDAPKPPPRRVTLALPYVCAARSVWVIAVGPRKLPVLQAAVAGHTLHTPLDIVMQRAKNVTVFTDQALRRGFVAR